MGGSECFPAGVARSTTSSEAARMRLACYDSNHLIVPHQSIDTLAQEFGVSAFVIEHQLMNHQIVEWIMD